MKSPISYKILFTYGVLNLLLFVSFTAIAAITVILQPEVSAQDGFLSKFWKSFGIIDLTVFNWEVFSEILGGYLLKFIFAIILMIFIYSCSLKPMRITLIISIVYLFIEGISQKNIGFPMFLALVALYYTYTDPVKDYCFSKNKYSVN
jgi:hypothetical protein